MNGIHDIAEESLVSLPRGNITEQFRSRGVTRIILEDLGTLNCCLHVGIWETIDAGLWRVNHSIIEGVFSIALNVRDELADWVFGVGHELAHAFCTYDDELRRRIHFAFCKRYRIDLPKNVDLNTPREDFHRYFKTLHLSEEFFCEIFSSLWTNYGNNSKELHKMLSLLSRCNSEIVIEELLPSP